VPIFLAISLVRLQNQALARVPFKNTRDPTTNKTSVPRRSTVRCVVYIEIKRFRKKKVQMEFLIALSTCHYSERI